MQDTVITATIGAAALVVGGTIQHFVSWAIFKRTAADNRSTAQITAEQQKAARIDEQGQIVFENLRKMYETALTENKDLYKRVETLENEMRDMQKNLTMERETARFALLAREVESEGRKTAEATVVKLRSDLDDCRKGKMQTA